MPGIPHTSYPAGRYHSRSQPDLTSPTYCYSHQYDAFPPVHGHESQKRHRHTDQPRYEEIFTFKNYGGERFQNMLNAGKRYEEAYSGYKSRGEKRRPERLTRAEAQDARMRLLQEQLERIQERMRQRTKAAEIRVEEWHKAARYRTRAEERGKAERLRTRKEADEARDRYHRRWKEILETAEPLSFVDIPWPTITRVEELKDITALQVKAFLRIAEEGNTMRDRIRKALLRWHPDRFQRLMRRATEKDKKAIEEGVGFVASCLNDLMAAHK